MKITNQIKIKSPEELEILREAGRILASIIKELSCSLKSGMTTKELDARTEELIRDSGVEPAFKGYRGFPACTCTSINQEVVHGIPSERQIRDGDIISVDVGIIHREYYSDTATTLGVGEISQDLQRLLKVTRESLETGIEKAQAGNHLSDISFAVQEFVERQGFAVVRDFVGHGIGKSLHEEPEIPNFGPPGVGPLLKEGMVLAIEPMVNMGSWETRITDDGWTVVTMDGKPSAHFEHCIAITTKGPEILTQ